MRTTIDIDSHVLKAYKQRAARRGTTFASEVEDALRAELLAQEQGGDQEPFELPVFDGEGGALIDIESNQAIQDLIDAEDRAGGRW